MCRIIIKTLCKSSASVTGAENSSASWRAPQINALGDGLLITHALADLWESRGGNSRSRPKEQVRPWWFTTYWSSSSDKHAGTRLNVWGVGASGSNRAELGLLNTICSCASGKPMEGRLVLATESYWPGRRRESTAERCPNNAFRDLSNMNRRLLIALIWH